jgi:hypothetical protein
MLICLEGVDGAGKSTLANRLAGNLPGIPYQLHFSQPERHPLAEYEATLDFYRPGAGDDVVCDRFHWGEMIYGDLYRGGSQLGLAGFWHVEQYLRSRGGIVVHVTAPIEVIRERLATRGEDYLQAHHVERVLGEFQIWSRLSFGEPYNVLSPVGDGQLEMLLDAAARAERSARFLAAFPGYVGPPIAPRLLLVGERPNVKAKTVHHEAPFVPYSNTAARYLIDNVILRLPQPSTVGLVNAYNHAGEATNLRELWRRLGSPSVVSLGVTADRACRKLDVPHLCVPHPQYWRRFHHHEPDKYRDLILDGFR